MIHETILNTFLKSIYYIRDFQQFVKMIWYTSVYILDNWSR